MSKIDALDEDDAEKTVTVLQHLITDAESKPSLRKSQDFAMRRRSNQPLPVWAMHMRFEITEHGAPAFPCLHLTKRKTMPCIRRRLVLALTAAAAASLVAAADLTVCSGTGMDWYTDMVGETPCTTYQRLRQICNSQFAVGTMNVNTPPDFCTDQVSSCCCNTVAFALSMLCLNCQQNIGNTTGYDAGTGAYQIYLSGGGTSSCANPTTQALPKDIQTAVCNEKIKIDNDIYGSYWSDGAWFYVYTRDTIIKDNIVANNNSFTKCASTTINATSSAGASASLSSTTRSSTTSHSSSSTSSSTTTPAAATHNSTLASGAIAGIAVGAVVGLLALAGFGWLARKRRAGNRTRAGLLDDPLGGGGGSSGGGSGGGGVAMGAVDASLIAHSYSYHSPSLEGGGTHPGSSSDYFGGGGGASEISTPGFAGLGAASTYNALANANVHDPQSGVTTPYSGALTPRRGFHTTQPSTSSLQSSNPYGGVAPSVSGSSSSGGGGAAAAGAMGVVGAERREAGPLPRKHRGGPGALPPGAAATMMGQRSPSEEPFLEVEERDPWQMVDERHTDAGPIDGASLGRSASGRLPPAYGELIG